jgi:dihydroorotate dehydrogenase subfamily 1
MNLNVNLFGKKFDNPLLPASGPVVGNLHNLLYFNEAQVGGIVTKTISVEGAVVRKPCIVATKHCVFNTELWSEYALEKWAEDILPELARVITKPLIVSVGYTSKDFEIVVPRTEKFADFFEVSTHYGLDELAALVKKITNLTDKPVFVKLSPHITEYLDFVRTAIENGAKGIVAINSLGPGMVIDLAKKAVKIGVDGGKSWVSGPAIKPVALNRVSNIRSEFPEIGIIACGGVENAEDVLEFVLAGADLVQMLSSSMMKGRALYNQIVSELPLKMKKYQINSMAELREMSLKLEPEGVGGYPEIDHERCTKCGICVNVCPVMAMNMNTIVENNCERCIQCGLCESKCPVEAIKGVL